MMHHTDGQETAPQCTDPASLDWPSQEEAGWNFAASLGIKDAEANYKVSPYLRESDDPFARGYRCFIIRSGTPKGARRD